MFHTAGRVSVQIDERKIASCGAGMPIGEIGLPEPFKGRSATLVAIDKVVVAHLTAQHFIEIAKFHPDGWRRLAMELARRLVKSQTLLCQAAGRGVIAATIAHNR